MKRLVAIKVLLRSLCQEGSFVQRFQREVETIARLSHPNIVMAYDADEAEVGHFLVMEFVNGRDLASAVQKQGSLSLRDVVSFTLQAARGMEYAHSQTIIHRDIKPANLLLDGQGVVKVTDLGLARLNNAADRTASDKSGLTQAGGILGTVDYMSPEQAIDSTTIDHRADIYSLGCTLYFLLTGRVPYQGASLMQTLLKHREAPIPYLPALRPDVPAALDSLYRKMVAKSPADRCQTMADVVKALEAIEPTLGVPIAGPSHSPATPEGGQPPAPLPAFGQTVDLTPPSTHHDLPLSLLLVEPSRTQAVIIRKYLQGLGIEPVATVSSGQSALEVVRKERPHVIVSAMHINDMTGVQLARQVLAETGTAAIGFVLISSQTESQEVGSLSKTGTAAILTKPFSIEQLAEVVSLVSRRKLKPVSASDSAGAQTMCPGAAVGSKTTAPASGRGKLKVLLVDDSGASRIYVRGVLRNLGFSQVVEAADGAQAVAAVARETFDLVVTDYNMPYMDGQGLVAYLRQQSTSAAVPIILVTTEQDPGKLAAMRQLGVTAICDKSFKPEVVSEILSRLFPW